MADKEMVLKEEFLKLLRTDQLFREEVRRQLLTEELLTMPAKLDHLIKVVKELAEAQRRTEEGLQRLVSWQIGEKGRRDGERYERETVRRAPVLFNGGRGGTPEEPWVQQQLAKLLGSRLALISDKEEDPFLADLIWWKDEKVMVVEVSLQINGQDITRATRRAQTLKEAGLEAIAVVIGEEWASLDIQEQAQAHQVEWKVGSNLSPGFVALRRMPPGKSTPEDRSN